MKKMTLFVTCGMLLFLLSCFSCENGDTLTHEELRLQKIALMDTALSTYVRLDSIEGFDRLAGLSAEAWMLVDDYTGFIISEKNWRRASLAKGTDRRSSSRNT